MTWRRATVVVAATLLLAGCGLFNREATRALKDADAQAARGDYKVALAAYDRYLEQYPDDDGATRVRAVRALMAELVSLRTEVAALRERVSTREAELSRVRGDASEVARLRHELSVRQAEVSRLKEDLEALKRTDLHMERRRR